MEYLMFYRSKCTCFRYVHLRTPSRAR